MDKRKNATKLTADERAKFLEAIIKLKHRRVGVGNQAINVYDQYVALHGAVMAVTAPGVLGTTNFAHGNIGFLPWHRQYLREFEKALQQEVPGVTLPYWDWSDDIAAAKELFTSDFLSSVHWGAPTAINDGVLRARVPVAQRPSWWPNPAQGFRVHQLLEEGQGANLSRGSMEPVWPPTNADMTRLEQLNISIRGSNPLWAFHLVLESGHNSITGATHNAGHRFIGGHMAGEFSPNDPVFWLHHANVDRVWANWQEYQQQQNPGSIYLDHWPRATEASPFSGAPAPAGHKAGEMMWPWVGHNSGYRTVSVSAALQRRLKDYTGEPVVHVDDVLDYKSMEGSGYEYE